MDEIIEALKAEIAQLRADIDFVAFEIFGKDYNEQALLEAYKSTPPDDLRPINDRDKRLPKIINSRGKIFLAMAIESFYQAVEVPTTLELMQLVILTKGRISAAFGTLSEVSREEMSMLRASSAKKTEVAIEGTKFKHIAFEHLQKNPKLKPEEIYELIDGKREVKQIKRWIAEFRTLQN